ncbi:gamma-glutamyl-gamma-aminobutyrate hydrolase family protein [Sinomonas terrae]|uniref:Gamma-glutamyl-gamma-aminobutyrate hydrolase family protein n=1 Tax=Sinomonas terrae TaxID=2908838 RepID=A0ABS9TWL3_9MICC|nr:gamma-glutamyl-gamma-aminobutyrate hydrolase family protein [Sinomonas terrae]MCH6468811.1 gamma-glutamyl-gamma-aminobutyrate hydrolase family protein [Sinomonas terrae]
MTPPRIAVTWPGSAPAYPEWFHAELDRLTKSAADAVERAGGTAVVFDAADPQLAGALLRDDDWDGLLVMGGGDVDPLLYDGDPHHPSVSDVDPTADAFEASAVVHARAAGRPVLGICRGLQIINVALGGSLHEDLPFEGTPHRNYADPSGPMVPHEVTIEPGSRLAAVVGTSATVPSGHHQAAARVADGLRVVAQAPDCVIEALEAEDPGEWIVAVQWHPEDAQGDPEQLEAIMGALVEACRQKGTRGAEHAREEAVQ